MIKMAVDIDEALALVGGCHRYHLGIFILLGLSSFIPLCWQGLGIVFIGWEPPHHCLLPEGQLVNESMPTEIYYGQEVPSRCLVYENRSLSNQTMDCTAGWHYEADNYTTIVTEWDLVCGYNYLAEMSQLLYQAASLGGELIGSYLIDRFGRRNTHVGTHIVIAILGTGVAFSQYYTAFIIVRAVMGFVIVLNLSSGATLMMELFDSKRRALAGIGLEFLWVLCYLLLPLFAWLIHSWRYLQLLGSLLSLVWIIYFWLLPESTIWLVAKGKYAEAEVILLKMAKYNGHKNVTAIKLKREGDEDLLDDDEQNTKPIYKQNDERKQSKVGFEMKNLMDNESDSSKAKEERKRKISRQAGRERKKSIIEISQERKKSIIDALALGENKRLMEAAGTNVSAKDLFTDYRLRRHLLCGSVCWLANNMVYYGLILATPHLASSRFLGFLYSGLVEIPSYVIALVAVQKIGRRIPVCVFHIIAGIPIAVSVFIPKVTASGTDLSALITTMGMLSKFGISASFAVLILYTTELFPTTVRGRGMAYCNVLGRIGNMLAPFAVYAGKTSLYWLPNIIFGVLSLVAGFVAVLFLPETIHKPLPNTLQDIHNLYNKDPDVSENEKTNDKADEENNYVNPKQDI